jgi:hypothetical protein
VDQLNAILVAMRFLVARNPDSASSLPYLLRLPINDGLVLKARDTWPRTARVNCHPAEAGWPAEPEILEDVPVIVCTRRGRSIDLVLDRPRENRSKLVFTGLPGGRPGIFWQTRKTAATARPGARIPGRRPEGLGLLRVRVDTRERHPYRFASRRVETERAALAAGDYAALDPDGGIVAVVERKAVEDMATSLNNGTIVFELARLVEAGCAAAVVVEGRYSDLVAQPYAADGFLPDLLARVQVRYREVPIVFTETRPLAEEWTFRFLAAALAEHLDNAVASRSLTSLPYPVLPEGPGQPPSAVAAVRPRRRRLRRVAEPGPSPD